MGGGAVVKTRSTLDFARFRFCEFTKSLAKVNCRRYAFTLAEVLITITVIGVVAALTIPNLVNNYQNRAWNTASAVFQRKLGEALKVMNSQGTLAGYSSTEDFVNELSKHIKINKICKNDEITSCFEDTVFWGNDNEEVDINKIKFAASLGQRDWQTKTIGVQFADGITGIIAYNPECIQDPYRTDVITVSKTGIGTNCLAILYDTSGFKKPNTQSKDLRGLNVDMLNENCAIKLPDGTCFSTAFKPISLSKEECKKEMEKGDLGITDCYWDLDYWAGAAKQCKGVQNLPSYDDLTAFANYVFNLDKDQLNLIGLPDTSTFEIWTNLTSIHNAYYARFNTTNKTVTKVESYKLRDYTYAMCKGN